MGEDVEARDVEEVGAQVAVDQHQHGDDRKGRPDASPCPLQDEQEGETPHDELGVIGASGPHADVVELEKDVDGDHAGHERKEEIEIGHVVLLVVDGLVPDEGIDRPDPLEEEQAQDGEKDPQQENPPEDQRRVEVLEPGADVQVRPAQPDPVERKPDHGRVDGQIDGEGQAIWQVLALLEVEHEGKGHDGKGRGGAEGKAEDLPEDRRVEHGRHAGIEDVVDEVLAPFEVDLLLHRVNEEDQRKHEGQVEGAVAPLLQDTETRRVDVEDRKDDRHGKDQPGRHPRELAETRLGVVLGDLIDVVLELGG